MLTCLNYKHAEIRYILNDSLDHQVAQSQAYLYLWTTLYKHTFDEHKLKLSCAWHGIRLSLQALFLFKSDGIQFQLRPNIETSNSQRHYVQLTCIIGTRQITLTCCVANKIYVDATASTLQSRSRLKCKYTTDACVCRVNTEHQGSLNDSKQLSAVVKIYLLKTRCFFKLMQKYFHACIIAV